MFSRIRHISTGKIRPDRFMRKKVFLYILLNETEIKQESIPVGCVPAAR